MRRKRASRVRTEHSVTGGSYSYGTPAGSIIVKQIGHANLTVALPGGKEEKYLITLPRLRIDGIWYGSPYIELTDTSYIQSSSGWTSTVSSGGSVAAELGN